MFVKPIPTAYPKRYLMIIKTIKIVILKYVILSINRIMVNRLPSRRFSYARKEKIMGKFVIINIILKSLENAMEKEDYDLKDIPAEVLGIDKALWKSIVVLLIENGYVKDA